MTAAFALPAGVRRERAFIAMWVALAGAAGLASVLAFGPFRSAVGLQQAIAALPPSIIAFLGIGDLANRSRFVDEVLFGLLAPISFLSFSIGVGTRAGICHDDAMVSGGHPVRSSPQGLTGIATLMIGGNVLLGAALVTGVIAGALITGMPVTSGHLATAVGADIALGCSFGILGALLAVLTRRVGVAALIVTALAIGADALNGLGPADPALHDVRYLSLVYYAEGGHPWSAGVTPAHILVLCCAALVTITLAWMALRRRTNDASSG